MYVTLSAVSSTPFGVLTSNHSHRRKSSGDDDDDDSEAEGWCGPFSVARQMIARREEAKRKREEELAGDQELQIHHPLDGLMNEVSLQQQRKIHPSMQWRSRLSENNEGATKVASTYAKRQRRFDLFKSGTSRIPSLFQITVNFIVDNFEDVESLGVVENDVRVAIANELVARNKLDGGAFEALIETHTMETLEIMDCAGIPQDAMASALASIVGLRYLLLTHAGRCFGRKAVNALLEKNAGAQLCCLSIAGAYLLQDEDAAKIIEAHDSTLQSIAFRSCPLLGDKFVTAIHNNQTLGKNLLELSLQDMSLSGNQLEQLVDSKEALRGIKSLTLRSITGLTDEVLAKILEVAHEFLDSLDIGYNYSLSDATLSSIRKHNSLRLLTLVLDGIKGMTAAGLEALFTHPLEGLPPPPKLKVLKLASIDHEAVTDELLRLVTAGVSATQQQTDEATNPSVEVAGFPARLAPYRSRGRGGGLVQLDVQGSTLVTDQMLEHLVETSATTLETLNVSYCPLIQDQGLGYLVSKLDRQLTKIEVWGCAQLTDDFFDGHDRVQDGTLEIIGAWMKKSGTRTLR
eukprot:jgi/Psemu1/287249/fgenesh1_pg.181_\